MSTTVTNGIDVDGLLATIDAVKSEPELATFTFRATTSWVDGTHNVGRIGHFQHAGAVDESRAAPFVLDGDEPPALLGANRGPNAVELVLQALGFCYAVGVAANAAARGVEITSMRCEVEGDIDVGPFLGLPGSRPGFTAIRARLTVASPNADDEQLTELSRYVQQTSPVHDIIANPVPVTTTLEVGAVPTEVRT